MKVFETPQIRNIVLVGHSGSGKTTLGEAMMFSAGAMTRLGKVAEGSSVLDFTPEEHKRSAGVYLSLAQFEFEGKKINLLDAPGYADFIGEVYSGIRAADCGVIVVSATAGVEPDTERHFSILEDENKPRFFVVNHMDKEQADFDKVVGQIRETVTDRVVPLFYPIGSGPDFRGVVDVMAEKAFVLGADGKVGEAPVPDDLKGMIEEAKGKLVELAAESDDAYLEKYLETLELSPEETSLGLHKGILAGRIFPVFGVSADKNQGVRTLMRKLVELAPSPLEAPGPALHAPGAEGRATINPSGPLAAQVFKISSEIMAQEVSLIRVFAGTIESGSEVYVPNHSTGERMGQLYHFLGKERSDADRLVAGDIGAAAKLKSARLGDTLSTKDKGVTISPIPFPAPVHEVSVRSTKQGDEEKVGTAFARLRDEDPCFHIEVQSDLHQTVLKAMGDQHVDVISERLARKFKVEIETSKPRLPYRETIRGTADVSYRHKKQTGGRGQFADVSIKVEPTPRGAGYEFSNEITGGVIPTKFIPAVEKGVVESLPEGVLAGYPVVDVKVRLHFGGYHDVDSSEMAFKLAASQAFKKGMQDAQPVLLEPIMAVEIEVPEDYTGGVMGDLSSRRGKIMGMEPIAKGQRIKAAVPQGELYRYSTNLRTITQGRARYHSTFSHYEEVPREVVDKLVEELRREREAVA